MVTEPTLPGAPPAGLPICTITRPDALPAVRPHSVREGETRATISAAYGVPWERIADANGLGVSFTLTAGQLLLIPVPLEPGWNSPDAAAYVVARGRTLVTEAGQLGPGEPVDIDDPDEMQRLVDLGAIVSPAEFGTRPPCPAAAMSVGNA